MCGEPCDSSFNICFYHFLFLLLQSGCTALHLACSHGNYEVMKLLVGAFADVNSISGVSLLISVDLEVHVLVVYGSI